MRIPSLINPVFAKARTEATIVENSGLYTSESFYGAKDPNQLLGKYGKLGNFNAGIHNSNAFTDRPDDSKISQVFLQALKVHTDTTVEQMVKFANDGDTAAIRRVFFQARIPLYFSLEHAEREQVKIAKEEWFVR